MSFWNCHVYKNVDSQQLFAMVLKQRRRWTFNNIDPPCVLVFQYGALGFVEEEKQECWNPEFGNNGFGADALRRLAPIFQGVTPSCSMLHNFSFNECTKKKNVQKSHKVEQHI